MKLQITNRLSSPAKPKLEPEKGCLSKINAKWEHAYIGRFFSLRKSPTNTISTEKLKVYIPNNEEMELQCLTLHCRP